MTLGQTMSKDYCEEARKPAGIWSQFWWPKPGATESSRKLTYSLGAKGTPYVVVSGIYDDKATIAELTVLPIRIFCSLIFSVERFIIPHGNVCPARSDRWGVLLRAACARCEHQNRDHDCRQHVASDTVRASYA